MYRPLNVSDAAPGRVKRFIADHLDMQFEDVHCMLRLPMEEHGLRAGCNFAAAGTLLALIGGASVVLYRPSEFATRGNRGELFTGLLRNHYPWFTARQALGRDRTIEKLWEMYRAPLAHALGLHEPGQEDYKVLKLRHGLAEAELEELEGPGPCPVWVRPTMERDGAIFKLNVSTLYWGVRRMVEELTRHPRLMRQTDALLERQGWSPTPPADEIPEAIRASAAADFRLSRPIPS
jgi:hypothetical protein